MVDFARLRKMSPAEQDALLQKAEARVLTDEAVAQRERKPCRICLRAFGEHESHCPKWSEWGKVVYVSASQNESWELCKRKWAFGAIDKVPRKDSDTKSFGLEVHGVAEAWLKRGRVPPETPAGATFKQGLKYLPTPSHELVIETKFDLLLERNIVMTGFIDVDEPPWLNNGRPRILDHKSTKSLKWRKTEAELIKDGQAAVYSVFAFEKYSALAKKNGTPPPEAVDVRFIYYSASVSEKTGERVPKGSKATEITHTRETLEPAWNRMLANAFAMADLKRRPHESAYASAAFRKTPAGTKITANDIEADATACQAYGGCDYRNICKLPKGSILAAHLRQFNRLNENKEHDADVAPVKADKSVGRVASDSIPEEHRAVQLEALQESDLPFLTQLVQIGIRASAKNNFTNTTGVGSVPAASEKPTEEKTRMAGMLSKMKQGGAAKPAAATKKKVVAAPAPAKRAVVASRLATVQQARGAKGVNPPEPEVEEPVDAEGEVEVEAEAEVEVEAEAEVEAEVEEPAEESAGFIVLYDAVPSKGLDNITHFRDVIGKVADVLARENETDRDSLPDDVLAEGFNAYLNEVPLEGILVVDSASHEARAVKGVLFDRATKVIRGIR